jgi:DNA adenine methylase
MTHVKRERLRRAAADSLSHTPRSFLRWAGSKRGLLKHVIDALPESYDTYYEPFLGSGALFFLLRPTRAVLGDSCAELIDAYHAVRDNPNAVLRYLADWRPDPDLYYEIRDNRSIGRLKRAAEFLYLNRTCWNGLYRVNSAGEFNVPYGMPKTDFIVDAENLRSCSKLLAKRRISIACADFEETLQRAGKGDLVFLDPPYVTGHNNNGFIDYNETLFSWSDQERLAAVAHRLARRGAHVIVTNAKHDDVVALYGGFMTRDFERPSTLASNVTFRRSVREVVLWSGGDG